MECQQCLKPFTADTHIPKKLPCGHCVCQCCLEVLKVKLCPMALCGKPFLRKPSMLPDHVPYLSMMKIADRAEAFCREFTVETGQGDAVPEVQEQAVPRDSLDSLPDDALVEVFRYLSALDVLRLRRVSRRWRDLLLLPDVWSHRRLVASQWSHFEEKGHEELGDAKGFEDYHKLDREAELVAAVLRVAPCVNKVSLSLRPMQVLGVGRLGAHTQCAVTRLNIDYQHEVLNARMVKLTEQLIQNQVALGRLRELDLRVPWRADKYSEADHRSLASLLLTVHSLKNLRRLAVWHRDTLPTKHAQMPLAWPKEPLPPSLKELVYESDEPDSWLEMQLRAHSATLESVELELRSPCPLAAAATTLLGTCPRLRSLVCPLLEDVEPDHFAALETLDIRVNIRGREAGEDDLPRFDQAVQRTKAMLRQAGGHLRSLALRFWTPAASGHALVQVLEAVAASGAGSLRQLLAIGPYNFNLWPGLVATLPMLPRLDDLQVVHLTLNDGDLAAMTPDTAPSLRTMTFCVASCLHCWVHRVAVVRFFRSNLRVHATVVSGCSDQGPCADCAGWACHGGLLAESAKGCAFFFGHGPGHSNCSLGGHQLARGHPQIEV